jgi:hypothetical protein
LKGSVARLRSGVRLAIFAFAFLPCDNLRVSAATKLVRILLFWEQSIVRLRVGWMMLWLVAAGTAVAQHAPAASQKAQRRSCVREEIFNSASERLRWEAAQTWTSPEIPERNVEPAAHAIHMDQPPLTAPKLRRDWLRPSQEAALENDASDLSDLGANGALPLLPRPVK